jgi:hypothetical protein
MQYRGAKVWRRANATHAFLNATADMRLGLGGNLDRHSGCPDAVVQRTLRHANVSTTSMPYIKAAADDVRHPMARVENVMASGVSGF